LLRVARFDLLLQGLDFLPEPVVFIHFALQKLDGELGFGLDAPRGQQIGIPSFAGASGKIADLHPAFFDERLQAVVQLAERDPQHVGQFPLGGLRVRLQVLEQIQGGFGGFGHVRERKSVRRCMRAVYRPLGEMTWFTC